MDFIIQGFKNFIAVVLGTVLIYYPANNPPSPLPSVPPNLQDSLTSVYSSPSPSPSPSQLSPAPTPNNGDQPNDSSSDAIIKISDEQSYYGNSIEYSIEFPKNGGNVKGYFKGTCNGDITGNYVGGDGGSVAGNAKGECNILFFKPKVDITYQGSVYLSDRKVVLSWAGEAPFGLKSGSITLTF